MMHEDFEMLRALVASLSAPHEDHCGSQCYGGRTDCCSICAVLEGLVDGVREANSTVADKTRPITLPAWCASVSKVRVMSKPSEKHRHKYCQTCWHRQPQAGEGPLLSASVEMKERYDEKDIGVGLADHPFLAMLRKGKP